MSDLLEIAFAATTLGSPAEQMRTIEDAGLSRSAVARHLGVARGTVGRWLTPAEQGGHRPRGDLLVRYAALLRELRLIVAAEPSDADVAALVSAIERRAAETGA